MDPRLLQILCDPKTHEPLEMKGDSLISHSTGQTYPIISSIPVLLPEEELHGDNLEFQRLYDRLAPVYNLSNKIYFFLKFGGEKNYRNQFLKELEIVPGDKVLEISVGTGDNFPYLPRKIDLYGLDISFGMLKACRRNLKKWKREAAIVQAAAEAVPFRDESFDVVYHVGGINFFNDKARAIEEMIRVAKRGSKIVIVDETEKLASTTYNKTPFVRQQIAKKAAELSAPVDYVPETMQDLEINEICNGLLYCLSFRKP